MSNSIKLSKIEELSQELKKSISGEIRFDQMSKQLYSTDASIYQIEPVGIVLPKTQEDVINTIQLAKKYKIPVLPRGGGTSLAGQTVGNAIVIDFSKYMRNLIEVNQEEKWAITQPGIILDELNSKLKNTGLHFSPDPSTSNRGNIGGALGNNSCGAHSIIWGKTVDNILEIDSILSNGNIAKFGKINTNQIFEKIKNDSLESNIYQAVININSQYKNEIIKRYPNIERRVSGYNLDELLDLNKLNMSKFIVGSEGTLTTITQAKIKLVENPKFKGISLLYFNSLYQALEATVHILKYEPSAIELVGNMILTQAKTNIQYSRMLDFLEGEPESLLIVEMNGETEQIVHKKLQALKSNIEKTKLTYATQIFTKSKDQSKIWAIRKAGLGLMMNVPGPAKPIPFVEDTAVSPEKLPEFTMEFDKIIKNHETIAGYYGHAGAGCLHIRPLIDLKTNSGVQKMESISKEISDLVIKYNGSMSGEHGDGLARSMWNKKLFGEQIYSAFQIVKNAFDPESIMNPGKIINSENINQNLRTQQSLKELKINPNLYTSEIDFRENVEMCNGQGACRKVTSGTMCPSYMITRDEEHSTRGRANALKATMNGLISNKSFNEKRLYEVMDLCLECKACKAECPSNVDMAKLKYEFLNSYFKNNKHSLRNILFANIALFSKLGTFFNPITNWIMKSSIFKKILNDFFDIDQRRSLPLFANQTFSQWYKSRSDKFITEKSDQKVILFIDTFTEYNHPNLGILTVQLIESLGYEVIIPKVKCCGRPMLSKGMIESAKKNAIFNINSLYEDVKNGTKLIGIEPSCILNFKDDYLDLTKKDKKALIIKENTLLLEEFIIEALNKTNKSLKFPKTDSKILFQGHCHQKALNGTETVMNLLQSIVGKNAIEIDSGCCGMAGSFGYEKEHYDISIGIANQSLFPAIESQKGDFEIVSEGISCRQQIEFGTNKKPKHLIELLAECKIVDN